MPLAKLDNWQTVDLKDPTLKRAYDAYKADYAKVKEKRQTFEDAFTKHLKAKKIVGPDERVVVGYNWGKLQYATTAADTPKQGGKNPVAII